VTAVFDSRRDDLPYYLSIRVNGKAVDCRRPMPDPFHNTTLTTRFGWRDRLRILMGRPVTVCVSVDATPEVVEGVLELDENYRSQPGSQRRREADAELHAALAAVGESKA
jgi:hypothetical protein